MCMLVLKYALQRFDTVFDLDVLNWIQYIFDIYREEKNGKILKNGLTLKMNMYRIQLPFSVIRTFNEYKF